jgi:tetratricopeptide (TPR) repeat protein
MMQRIIDRVNQLDPWIGVSIALMTIYAAIIGMLQVQAGNLNTQYRAETQRYAIESMRIRSVGETQSAFDTVAVARMVDFIEQQRSLAESRNDTAIVDKMDIMREALNNVSPILKPPYDALGDDASAHYDVELYIRDATRAEQYRAAYAPMDAGWDSKANTYVVHLTLLALVLALLGLGVVMHDIPRAMVLTMAGIITIVTTGWVITTYLEPVPTLNPAAIEAYTNAYSMAYEGKTEAALTGYADAITKKTDYADAYYEQALLLFGNQKYPEALQSLASARKYGYDESSIDYIEGYIMMLQGDFVAAETATNAWLTREPHSIAALGQQVAVAYARDNVAVATTSQTTLIDEMRSQVAAIRTKGDEPEDQMWVIMNENADVVNDVVLAAQQADMSSFAALTLAPATTTQATSAVQALRSAAITLEYNLKPASGSATDIQIGVTDDQDVFTAQDSFPANDLALIPLVLQLNAQQIAPGAHVLVRFYVDGSEDESLRYVSEWSGASDGLTTLIVPIDLGPAYVLPAGNYAVELYIDGSVQGAPVPFQVAE